MIFEILVETRYPDMDQMGIAHHAVYPIWYEMARMDLFSKIGFSFSDMKVYGINPAMVNLNIQYAAPARYPETLTIKTFIKSFAPKKLELSYAIYRSGRDEPIGTATSFHIWTGPDMKSFNLEQDLPQVYEKLKKAAESTF